MILVRWGGPLLQSEPVTFVIWSGVGTIGNVGYAGIFIKGFFEPRS